MKLHMSCNIRNIALKQCVLVKVVWNKTTANTAGKKVTKCVALKEV